VVFNKFWEIVHIVGFIIEKKCLFSLELFRS